MGTSADISGILRGLGELRERGRAAALRGVDIAGEHVIGDSQGLCPVDTGALAASGTTEPARFVSGNKISKAIGHNTDYAAAVHEGLTANHPQGQAKYLETAIRQNAPKMGGFVGGVIAEALNSGGASGGGGR